MGRRRPSQVPVTCSACGRKPVLPRWRLFQSPLSREVHVGQFIRDTAMLMAASAFVTAVFALVVRFAFRRGKALQEL